MIHAERRTICNFPQGLSHSLATVRLMKSFQHWESTPTFSTSKDCLEVNESTISLVLSGTPPLSSSLLPSLCFIHRPTSDVPPVIYLSGSAPTSVPLRGLDPNAAYLWRRPFNFNSAHKSPTSLSLMTLEKKIKPKCPDCELVDQQQPYEQPTLCCTSCKYFINYHLWWEFFKAT